MQRDLHRLADGTFDVVIIGGGVYGLATAHDAALRGLRVALVERGDFGHATSAASLKLIHGGLRYLQHLNFTRMRVSIAERRAMLRIAPHLVHPLEFVIPCYGHGMRGPEALRLALLANDVISCDRHRGLDDPAKRIPAGRMISAAECLERLPGLRAEGLTGAGLFHDAQMYSSERLTLAFARSAAANGAALANYVEAVGFAGDATRLRAVRVRDAWTGSAFEIAGRLFLNLTGPWSDITAALVRNPQPDRRVVRSKGIQIITRQLAPWGFALESRQRDSTVLIKRGGRSYFVTPWRGCSMIGTTDTLYRGRPEDFAITRRDVAGFVAELAAIYPAAGLTLDDVRFWVGGLRPVGEEDSNPEVAKAAHKYEIVDHAREGGVENLLSVVGVKYTICRHIAARVVAAACAKLGRPAPPCRTATTPLHGGRIDDYAAFLRRTREEHGWTASRAQRLARLYGSALPELLELARQMPGGTEPLDGAPDTLRAEVPYAVRTEMAGTLTDVVLRRTDLGGAGHPGRAALEHAAALMAAECGWDDTRRERELAAAEAVYVLPD